MKKAIILGLLACSTLLVGCSNNKKTSETSKESKIVKSSSNKEASVKKPSSEIKSSETTEQTTFENTPQGTQVETSATEQDIDPIAIFNGDISSIVGRWERTEEDYLIINSDWTYSYMTDNGLRSLPFKVPEIDYNTYMRSPSLTVVTQHGYPITLLPIGFPNLLDDQSNIDRPRITWGTSPSDRLYYRK